MYGRDDGPLLKGGVVIADAVDGLVACLAEPDIVCRSAQVSSRVKDSAPFDIHSETLLLSREGKAVNVQSVFYANPADAPFVSRWSLVVVALCIEVFTGSRERIDSSG